MQRMHPLNDVMTLQDRREHGVSNFAVYSLIGAFLLAFWLTVLLILF